jgi:hypothetical protein
LKLPTEQALKARFNLVGLASFVDGTNGRPHRIALSALDAFWDQTPGALPQALIERRAFSAKGTPAYC